MTATAVRLSNAGMPDGPAGAPLLDAAGPDVVLGDAALLGGLVAPVAPSPSTLFGPRGATLFGDGMLAVADTGHHRVLLWSATPTRDGAAADVVLGQPGFEREGRNALGEVAADTLNVPTGVAPWPTPSGDEGLVVADTWNNRVLVWHRRPTRSGTPADMVLGQADFTGGVPNRGGPARADTLHWPAAALVIAGALVVCDTGNRRVLLWRTLPQRNGQPADVVLGQRDMDGRSDNGGAEAGPGGMRWPHDACLLGGDLAITDAGDNRVLVFDGVPLHSGAEATRVLGQRDAFGVDHNQGRYWPTAATLNMPYAIDADDEGRLLCADTANSRLVSFAAGVATGAEATALTGQPHFAAKGDNRWGLGTRDSLCWPYGVKLGAGPHRGIACVADTGNHRVCLWRLTPGGRA